jgi:hypothetical protein
MAGVHRTDSVKIDRRKVQTIQTTRMVQNNQMPA